MKKVLALAALLAAAGAANGATRINEFFFNPSGTDNGFEFFELAGTPGQSLANTWLLIVEGDGSGAGVIDQAFDLSSFSLGSNGLFLWRDAATVLNPAPDAGTTINVADFNPDIENGTNTWLLVTGFSGALGNDLDTDNDGALDSSPWASVIEAVGYTDGAAGDIQYASLFGGNTAVAGGGIDIEAYAFGTNGVGYFLDIDGTSTVGGPYTIDNTETIPGGVSGAFALTPGSANTIPSPGAMALLGLGALVGVRRRRA